MGHLFSYLLLPIVPYLNNITSSNLFQHCTLKISIKRMVMVHCDIVLGHISICHFSKVQYQNPIVNEKDVLWTSLLGKAY